MTRTLDVSGLPPYDLSSKSLLWPGQLLLCVIEGSLFCILIPVYFYLRLGVDVWPPPGVQIPHATLSGLALIPLLLSCIGSYMADEAAKKNDRRKMLLGMGLNLILAFVFLAMRAVSWHAMNFNWATDAHGTIVWSILFLHTYDVIADLLVTAVLFVVIASGRYGERQRVGVHADSALWYFLVGIWIPFYVIIWWGPHFLRAQ